MVIKTISLNGDNMSKNDSTNISEIIYEILQEQGIDADSLSWCIEVDYSDTPDELLEES